MVPQEESQPQPDTPDIQILNQQTSTCGYSRYPCVVGEVINNSDSMVDFVKAIATFYDSEGKVIGSDTTYVTLDSPGLAPHQSLPFELSNNDMPFSSYKLDVTGK